VIFVIKNVIILFFNLTFKTLFAKITTFLITIVLLSSCSSYSHKEDTKLVIMALNNDNPAIALQVLESQDADKDNVVLENLHRGLLLHRLKKYKQSNKAFEIAKNKMTSLYGASISDQFKASIINDSYIEYAGDKYEQLIVHGFQILNYLFMNDVSGARVEVLQANTKMNKWGKPKSGTDGYLWIHYLSGVVYEINNEDDSAIISYRKAYRIAQSQNKVNRAIYEPYIKLSYKLGFKNEYNKLSKLHNFNYDKNIKQETLLIFFNGTAPVKKEHRLLRYSNNLNKNVGIVLPFYPKLNNSLIGHNKQSMIIENNINHTTKTQQIESIEVLARSALQKNMPTMITRSLIRQVAKYQIISQADADNKNSLLLGIIARITSHVTERADTRSWFSLPNEIQIARSPIDKQAKTVRIKSVGFTMKPIILKIKSKKAIIPITIFSSSKK